MNGSATDTLGPIGRRFVTATMLGWLAMIGVDVLLHAGLLAPLVRQGGPFLLEPRAALRLVPVGYLASLLLAVLLVWLMARLGIASGRRGGEFGTALGVLVWGAFVLGLLAVSTAGVGLLGACLVGETVELAVGGAVVGAALGGMSPARLFARVAAFVLVMLGLAVVLQNVLGGGATSV